jgi:glutamate synthase domain-containing protein 3
VGIAYVLDLDPATGQPPTWSTSRPSTPRPTSIWLRTCCERACRADRLAVAGTCWRLAVRASRRFCKVMPRDYRAVLRDRPRAEAEGSTTTDRLGPIMEASRG